MKLIKTITDRGQRHNLLVVDDGVAVANISYIYLLVEKYYWVFNLYVVPEHRRRGIATQLLKELVLDIKNHLEQYPSNNPIARLRVSKNNPNIKYKHISRMYTRLHWRPYYSNREYSDRQLKIKI